MFEGRPCAGPALREETNYRGGRDVRHHSYTPSIHMWRGGSRGIVLATSELFIRHMFSGPTICVPNSSLPRRVGGVGRTRSIASTPASAAAPSTAMTSSAPSSPSPSPHLVERTCRINKGRGVLSSLRRNCQSARRRARAHRRTRRARGRADPSRPRTSLRSGTASPRERAPARDRRREGGARRGARDHRCSVTERARSSPRARNDCSL